MKPLDIGKVMQLAEIKNAKRNGVDTLYAAPEEVRGALDSNQVRSAIEAIVESINEAIAEGPRVIHFDPAAPMWPASGPMPPGEVIPVADPQKED